MKSVEIYTANSMYENDECVGGYHEIHKINYLQNARHLIATIESIIKNNLLYGCDETVLEDITVSCKDSNIISEVNKHFNGKCGKVSIHAEVSYT